ncbi:histone acetyltransferase HPA2 [Pseudomonas fluvialis]|uniref:Histone acetyltransferase HPA2 n=1 Tax=Pseudomonas fluvialis TaxID=1793966 RepID=A0A2I0CQQ3_9PSED|nr:histone acetyltransferase HPA2 [Pseudomonas pharmacofabricae]PKF71477.1 histone acetyltransferase HPA2 [Pseudomonas pharmacofabricae]
MHEEDASPQDAESPELPAIDFQSPGRFSIHNPASPATPGLPASGSSAQPALPAGLKRFSSPEQACQHALTLLQQARFRLCLYSHNLEPWLYDHRSVQEACKNFLLASPKNSLRILLRDSSLIVKQGHRLLNLARRLSSNLQIRRVHPDYPAEDICFLLVDDCALLTRPQPNLPTGYVQYNEPARVRQRLLQFEQAWNTSQSDPELRSFLL